MKNIKKFLSLCIALMMILTSGVVIADDEGPHHFVAGTEYEGIDLNAEPVEEDVFLNQSGLVSYADTNENNVVGILGTLGVMGAYKDTGLFKPNVYISRAEFLEHVMKLMKIGYTENPSSVGTFYDIADDSPYYSMVYTAVKYGIVSGNSNNNFYPENTITYNEAVAIAVRALGYNPLAEHLGGWPLGYVQAAKKIGLTDNYSVNNPQALTRIETARLLENALYVGIDDLRYAVDSGITVEGSSMTLLEALWDIKKGDGMVNATRFGALKGSATDDTMIRIDTKLFKADENYAGFIGLTVDYWFNSDNTIVYMCKADNVDETIILAEDVKECKNGVLSYYKNNKIKTADVKNAVIFYNGTKPTVAYDEDIYSIKTGRISLISNSGSDVDIVKIEEYENFIIRGASLSNDEIMIKFEEDIMSVTVDTTNTYLDVYNSKTGKDSVYQVTDKGEEKIVTSPFKQYMVASVYAPLGKSRDYNGFNLFTGEGAYIKIVLSDEVVSGNVTAINKTKNELTIEDKVYKISEKHYLGNEYFKLDTVKKGDFLVDAESKIVALKNFNTAAKSNYAYGYLIGCDYSTGLSSGNLKQIKLIDKYGVPQIYNVTENFKINGEKSLETAKTKLEQSASMIKSGYKQNQLIMYKLNDDNAVTEIKTVTAPTGVASGYNEETDLWREAPAQSLKSAHDIFGNIYTPKDNQYADGKYFKPELIFVVPDEESDEEDVHSIISEPPYNQFVGEAYNVDMLTPQVLVIYETGLSADSSDKYLSTVPTNYAMPVLYDSCRSKINSDGDSVTIITVVGGWGTLEFECDGIVDVSNLVKGQMIQLLGKNNKVTRVKPLIYNYSDEAVTGVKQGSYVTPDNLPNVSTADNLFGDATRGFVINYELESGSVGTITGCVEAYAYKASNTFVSMYGDYINGVSGEREIKYMGRFAHKEWQHGGTMVYERRKDEDADKATVMSISSASSGIRYYQDIGESCSKILFSHANGIARMNFIYNIY